MFIEKMIEQTGCNTIKTENGAIGYKTTGKALLDMNFKISSYRSLSEDEIIKDFLIQEYNVSKEQADKLYHPSAMDAYPLVLRQSIGGKTSYD